ncbi:hypothetical protein Atep_30150 (plasmid) [Allochromatium tepidum]|uniref:Uncharacterized protein n=1 Tax=Allochromatium tepidum TaxID=553982 RepID=A0ABN6GFG0_9GAMM|nr:hypothetical protein Atep_30150 [Allochromatium tepidum]
MQESASEPAQESDLVRAWPMDSLFFDNQQPRPSDSALNQQSPNLKPDFS